MPPIEARGGLSSAEIERHYPHEVPIIQRGAWAFHEHAEMNERSVAIGMHRTGSFNGITCYRYPERAQADKLAEYVLERRLHRLTPNSTHGAASEEVALEWERMEAEREEVLAWGRATSMIRDVVLHYRFERKMGSYSSTAHREAAKLIEKAYPTVRDPLNYAGILIVWSERQHRDWFWRCCRDHHVL